MEAFLQEIPSCLRVRQRHFVLTTHAWSHRSWLAGVGQTALAGQSSRADQGCLAIGEASRCRAPDWVAAAAKHATKLRRCLFMGTSLFSFVRLLFRDIELPVFMISPRLASEAGPTVSPMARQL